MHLTWREFENRFDEHIYHMTYRECRNRINFKVRDELYETVRDLAQDVKLKLVKNDFKALKNFRGVAENSIYVYLTIIARNTVLNYIISSKPGVTIPIGQSTQDSLEFMLFNNPAGTAGKRPRVSNNVEQDFDYNATVEEINDILNRIIKGRNKERNILILQLYFIKEFSVDEIFDFLRRTGKYAKEKMAKKTIHNLISDTKPKLRQAMKQKIE